jgi:hypothetical protein
MGIDYYKDLDTHPFTGERKTNFKARVSEKEQLKPFFDGTPHYDKVENVTQGKVYEIHEVRGYGDVADFCFKDDIGEEHILGSFFFEKAD